MSSVMSRPTLLLGLLLASGAAGALNVSEPSRFECRQGNCANGQGKVWDAFLQYYMQGVFRGGQTIPGEVYTLTLPGAPNKTFRQVYGADGFLAEGDLPRTIGRVGAGVPYFSGQFQTIRHAFMRADVAVIKRGVYHNGQGIEYRGRFEYLAAKSGIHTGLGSGYYIFFGDVVDTEDDEKETGLYVSDEAIGGAAVRFVKANPGYLTQMQRKFRQDQESAKVDFAEKDAEQKWRSALAVIGKVGLALAGGGLSGGGNGSGGGLGGEIAANLVSGLFNSGSEGVNVKDLAMQVVGAAVTGDKQLGSALGKAISDGLDEATTK